MDNGRLDLGKDVNIDVNYGLFMDILQSAIKCPQSMLFTPGVRQVADTQRDSQLRGAGVGKRSTTVYKYTPVYEYPR